MPPYKFKIIKITDICIGSSENLQEQSKIYQQTVESYLESYCTDVAIYSNLEQTLFHGTDWNTIPLIKESGFRRDLNKRSVYGKGVYFAKDAYYSHHFTDKNANGERCLLVSKVNVGKYTQGRPDAVLNTKKYDSFVDNPEYPTIFVTAKDNHCIPYCMIVYKDI